MQLTGPEGRGLSINGFYYDTDLWKVRFSPPSVGTWTWALRLTTPTDAFTESGSFISVPSERPGFLRRHPANPFRLVFENGSLFNAIGIGDCIRDGDANGRLDEWGFDGDFRPPGQHEGWTVDMDTYMAAYGASGAGFNLFRWSVDNCAFKLWDTISADGNSYLVHEGILGDGLVEALRQNGFRIWMTIFGFNPAFPDAADHPPQQEAVQRYVSYVVARYGTYVDIWELMNEAHVPEGWIAFASDYLRSIDPYGRLISTSWERPELPQIDIDAPHWYEGESELDSDLVTSNRISHQRRWNKPIIFGEQGNTGRTGMNSPPFVCGYAAGLPSLRKRPSSSGTAPLPKT